MKNICRWCKREPVSHTNAMGYCDACALRDRENPPETTIQKLLQHKRPAPQKRNFTELIETEPVESGWQDFWKA